MLSKNCGQYFPKAKVSFVNVEEMRLDGYTKDIK